MTSVGFRFIFTGIVYNNLLLGALFVWIFLAALWWHSKPLSQPPATRKVLLVFWLPTIFYFLLAGLRVIIILFPLSEIGNRYSEIILQIIFFFVQLFILLVICHLANHLTEKQRHCAESEPKEPPPNHTPSAFWNRR